MYSSLGLIFWDCFSITLKKKNQNVTEKAGTLRCDSRSVSGIELLIEELVDVTVLMEGLMPYGGYTPVMAAVWDTHAAGSMGRIGSPVG